MGKTTLALAVLMLAAGAEAADRVIEVTMDTPVVEARRYAHITGAVEGLRQDEAAVVEWRDGLGRLLDFQRVRRGRAASVSFDFEMIDAWTTYNRIVVVAEGRGEYAAAVGEASFLVPMGPAYWNDYRLFLWPVLEERPSDYVSTLRESGFSFLLVDRLEDPEPLLRENLSYMVTSLLAGEGMKQSDDEWRKAAAQYVETRQAPQWPRDRHLGSARTRVKLKEEIAAAIGPVRYTRPAGYALVQGPSLTYSGKALDLSFDPETLEAFRAHLRRKYGSLSELGRAWGVRRRGWSDVRPETVLEAVDRYAEPDRQREPYNFAAWMEFRLFMDETFTGALEELAAHARSLDPDTPVGLMGCVTPSAFSGVDYLRLAGGLDFLESDGAGVLATILRARPQTRAKVLTQLDIDAGDFDARLWRSVLSGDHGAVLLDDEKFFVEGGRLSKTALARLETISAAGSGWLAMLSLPAEPRSRVALYYSRPSLLATTILDFASDPEDAGEYLRRWEPQSATYLVNLLAWHELLTDLGLDYDVVTARDWEGRDIEDRPYRVLVLPKLAAVGRDDLEALRRFVRGGGSVIADNLAGVMDAVGREVDASPLDELFGLSRRRRDVFSSDARGAAREAITGKIAEGRMPEALDDLRARIDASQLVFAEEGVSAGRQTHFYEIGDTDAVVSRETGSGGVAVYLNLSMLPYRAGGEKREALGGLIGGLFDLLDVEPEIAVRRAGRPAADIEVHTHQVDELYFVGLIRSGMEEDAEAAEYEISLPGAGNVYDLVGRKYYGPVNRLIATLRPGEPVLLGVLPYSVRFMELEVSMEGYLLTWEAEVLPSDPSARLGFHLFEAKLTDAQGKLVVPVETIVAYKGYAERDIMLSRDIAPGRYRLAVTDLVTNVAAEREFEVSIPEAEE